MMEKRTTTPSTTGVRLVTLAGLGLAAYGVALLVRNFTGFVELGLTPGHVGKTPEEIQSFSPDLYNYIIHVQVANSGFIIALGLAVTALALFGIHRGERWALWTALLAPILGLAIAIPLHYPFDLATLGHLGPIYLVLAILLAGGILSHRTIRE